MDYSVILTTLVVSWYESSGLSGWTEAIDGGSVSSEPRLMLQYNEVKVDNRGCVQITHKPTLVSSDFPINSLPVSAANKNQ